jgi:hypothetical protein
VRGSNRFHRRFLAGVALALVQIGCAPTIRAPDFQGAKSVVTGESLIGPFDGQVLDASTREPLTDVTLVAVWTFETGDGLVSSAGSETYETLSDRSGRYRIPAAKLRGRTHRDRLVHFSLHAYKRGYAGYRSDMHPDGAHRDDFVQRHNRIELNKWRTDASHAEHLFFLTPPRTISQRSNWEADLANREWLATQTGSVATGTQPAELTNRVATDDDTAKTPAAEPSAANWLDAGELIAAEEIAARTGAHGLELVRGDLNDLPRSATYHGVHFQAKGQPATYDFAYRVWLAGDDFSAVKGMIAENMPGAETNADVSDQTWFLENDELRAVAFIDEGAQVAVLVTCGVKLCVDRETATILAKFLSNRLDQLTTIPASAAPKSSEGTQP